MQFITSLFGGSGNTILTVLFALGAVLVLIVLGVWLLKFVFNMSGNAVRGRNRRLLVVDTLALDQKRQLVIIRRDEVEHLILTGGPQDVVIETGIPVIEEQPVATRRPIPSVPVNRPAPKAPPVMAEPAAPAMKAAPGTVLEALQQAGHTGDRKTRVSLRHTGLLRPVTQQDPTLMGQNTDISAVQASDSVKEVGSNPAESTAFGHDSSTEAHRR
ncbi:flagellar biosynthetic protein FliO [Devosia aurantiaca]|uniref:FliO/MopB family protein n=1 Tax=Devosia aurantiaca TaxID=2714858 RepID=A0A6M1SRX4_9HYPH|nr:flagellar biosynthetic protein FliO [Devosia aurantiaca]NGP17945.1 FliO/MopB family protein [Devosia aurantiaca]